MTVRDGAAAVGKPCFHPHDARYRALLSSSSAMSRPGGPAVTAAGPARRQYLAKFADTEGQKYLSRFYGKYRGKSADEALKTLVGGIVPAPVRLAVIYRSIMPENGLKEFSAFVKSNLPTLGAVGTDPAAGSTTNMQPSSFSLVDRGFLAHVHPLELWTVAYLRDHPGATQAETVRDSAKERQQVYTLAV